MKQRMSVIALALFMLCARANAQVEQGNVLVGADLANLNLSLDEGGNFSFRIAPKVAWFIRPNIAVGGYLLAGLNTAKGAGTDINYGVGALARYYFNKGSGTLTRNSMFFAEGTVGIEGDNPSVGSNTNGLGLGIGPGWTYFITSNIGLEALLKYNGIVGFGSKPTSNDLNLSVGFQIYLPPSKLRKARADMKN